MSCIGVTNPSSVSFMPWMISRNLPWNRVSSALVSSSPSAAAFARVVLSPNQAVDGVDALVEVVLDLVEVAVVVVGDLLGMSPLEMRSTYSAATFSGPTKASSVALKPVEDRTELALTRSGLPRVWSLPVDGVVRQPLRPRRSRPLSPFEMPSPSANRGTAAKTSAASPKDTDRHVRIRHRCVYCSLTPAISVSQFSSKARLRHGHGVCLTRLKHRVPELFSGRLVSIEVSQDILASPGEFRLVLDCIGPGYAPASLCSTGSGRHPIPCRPW